jgi:hypothetical protein
MPGDKQCGCEAAEPDHRRTAWSFRRYFFLLAIAVAAILAPGLRGSIARADDIFPLPVYWALGADPNFRGAVHLSAQQEKNLRELSDRCTEERQRLWRESQGPFDALRPDEQEGAFLKRTLQHREKLAREFRGQIEEVLAPAQIAACKRRSLAGVLAQVLSDPENLEQLRLTREQREKFSGAGAEWAEASRGAGPPGGVVRRLSCIRCPAIPLAADACKH